MNTNDPTFPPAKLLTTVQGAQRLPDSYGRVAVFGGIYNNASSPALTECNFCGNASDFGNRNIHGSAIDPASSGNLLLLNCNTGDVNFDLAIDAGDRLGKQFAQGFGCQYLFQAVEECVFGFELCGGSDAFRLGRFLDDGQ